VTKLAPKRVVGLMMGVWFLAAVLGNFLAGWIAGFADRVPLYRIFGVVCAVLGVAAVVLALLKRPIQRLAAAEDQVTEEETEVACVA
jgi:POT family proton-dependent oligopeptide transporter